MLMPSIFGENLFDDFFDSFPFYDDRAVRNTEKKLYGKHAGNLMKTDIKESDEGYKLMIDLPGFTKDEVQVTLKDGYLTIEANKDQTIENKDEKTNYVRKERYTGSMKRTFYVGEDVKEEDIQAAFKDGILKVAINKPDVKKLEDQKKLIPIL